MSGYSYEGYLDYLERCHANDPAANADFVENFNRYMHAKQIIKKGLLIKGITDIVKVIFKSKYYRPRIIQSLIIAGITKFIK